MMQALFHLTIIKPIEWLYLNAPEFGGFGGHEGLPKQEVCARITGVASHHWLAAGAVSCDLLIERKVRALASTILVILYVYLVVCLYCCVLQAVKAVVYQNISSLFKCSESQHRRHLSHHGTEADLWGPTPWRMGPSRRSLSARVHNTSRPP